MEIKKFLVFISGNVYIFGIYEKNRLIISDRPNLSRKQSLHSGRKDPYANQKDLCRSRKFVMLIFRLHDAGQWECKETGS